MGLWGVLESQRATYPGEKKNNNDNPQNMRLTATASREVTQRLMSTTSEQRLDREAQAASWVLRVRTRPECPEDNLRELK